MSELLNNREEHPVRREVVMSVKMQNDLLKRLIRYYSAYRYFNNTKDANAQGLYRGLYIGTRDVLDDLGLRDLVRKAEDEVGKKPEKDPLIF